MLVVHGTFDSGAGRFFLWAERDARLGGAPKKRGRKTISGQLSSDVPPHPYCATTDDLNSWLGQHGFQHDAQVATATLWLPGGPKQPQASPELRAAGLSPDDMSEPPELRAWRVAGLSLSLADALSLLVTLGHAPEAGRDLGFWRLAALEALALVAGQQVMPSLERVGFGFRARWQPLPQQPERLVALATHMPPVCRALTETLDAVLPPFKLLESFISAAVDATIRAGASGVTLLRGGPGAAWLNALTEADPLLKWPAAEADKLFTAWQTWSGQNSAAGNQAFRIAFRLDAPEAEAQDHRWTLHYLLQATDDPSLMVSAGNIWRGRGEKTYLLQRFDQPQERLLRGLAFAGRLFPPITDSLRGAAPQQTSFNTDLAYTFLQETAPLLQASGFRVLLPRWWGGKQARLTARTKVSSGKQTGKAHLTLDTLLRYERQLMLGGEPIDHDEFMRLAALKQPLVHLRGQWVLLDEAQIEAGLKFFQQGAGTLRLDEALRLGLDGNGDSSIPLEAVKTDGWLKKLLTTLQQPDKIEMPPLPPDLQAELRPYQLRGYAWLAFLRRYGLGACLADDMGLGKTLQTITLLLHLRAEATTHKPALVVCPTSVIGNWRRELARFAPSLKVLAHQGMDRASGQAFTAQLTGLDVLLTSYPLLARDRDLFEPLEWSTVILDEAQNIKNSATKQAQAACALTADYRLALTGTPVENRLTELWSIFHFINPGYLGGEQSFRKRFATPIEKLDDREAAGQLRRLTAPFILRRLKTDPKVISDLPEKIETKVYTPLTTEQGTLYEAVVKDVIARIEGAEDEGDAMSRRGLVLSLLMQLKQICNHPAQYLKDGSAVAGRSGKLTRLTEMLEEIYAAGDRVLIFTQFAEMGELLRGHLAATFYDEPLWLHGGTKVKEREELIHRFQAERGPTVFLLSLKAGGVGLNLTRANHVFHFDRWWNPAVENQATDRAFRIGQTRNVQVHKFVCAGTLEEKIDEMIESKKALADRIVGADESWLTELNTAQLRELVQLREVEA